MGTFLLDFDSTLGYDYLIGLSGKNPEVVSLYSNRVGSRQIPFLFFERTNVDKAEDLLGASLSAASFASGSADRLGQLLVCDLVLPDADARSAPSEINTAQDFDRLIAEGHLSLYFGTAEDNNNYNKDVLVCEEPASLTVCKEVVNDDGGTATSHDWDIVILDEDDHEVARLTPESDDVKFRRLFHPCRRHIQDHRGWSLRIRRLIPRRQYKRNNHARPGRQQDSHHHQRR